MKQGTGWNDILLPSKVNGLNRSRGRKHSSQPRDAPCPQYLLEHPGLELPPAPPTLQGASSFCHGG